MVAVMGPTRRVGRSSRRFPASRRRKLVWATTGPVNTASIAGGSTVVDDLLGDFRQAGASHLGITVMRTHLHIYPDNGTWLLGLVIGRARDDGLTLDPSLNNDIDWMFLDVHTSNFSGTAADQVTPRAIDLRAKRKMEEMGQSYVIVYKNLDTAAKTFRFFSRVLVALP